MEADLKEKITSIKVDGGASVNKLLVQFQADILGIRVIRPILPETTALGAARLAGLAAGFYTEADFHDEKADIYEPQMSPQEVARLYERWQLAIKATQQF